MAALNSWIDWYASCPLSKSMTWGGVTWPWAWDQTWLWPLQIKNISFDATWKEEIRWCLRFGSITTFGGVMSQKPNPDLRVIDLTSKFTGWPETLTWPETVGRKPLRLARGKAHSRSNRVSHLPLKCIDCLTFPFRLSSRMGLGARRDWRAEESDKLSRLIASETMAEWRQIWIILHVRTYLC